VTSAASTTAGAAAGTKTFTFVFSEPVGTSFSVEDLVVVDGTPGSFTKVDATTYTVDVAPLGSATPTVTLPAGKVFDSANNPNAVAITLTSSGGGTSTGAPTIDFSEATIGLLGFESLVSATVVNDPTNATNPVALLVKGPSGQPWAGVTVYTNVADYSTTAADLSTNKVFTLRSYTSAPVGTKITLKFENAADPGQNIAAETVTTTQNAWEILTFNFAAPTTGVFNPAATYNKVSIFPAFSIPDTAAVAPSVDTSFYFDDLTYNAIAGSGGGTGSGTVPTTAAPTPTVSAANVLSIFNSSGTYVDSNVSTYRTDWSNGTLSTASAGLTTVKKYSSLVFAGIEFNAPFDISAYDYVTFDAWSPDFASLSLKVVDFGANGAFAGGDDKEGAVSVTPLTKGTWNTYKIPLSDFVTAGLTTKAHIAQLILATNFPAETTPATVYIDNLYFGKTASTGTGTSGALVFSSGFSAGNLTVEGGGFGGFSGSNQDGYQCNGQPAYCGGGGSFVPTAAAVDSSFYYYYQTPTPATGLYAGVYLFAPGLTGPMSATADMAGLQIGSQTSMKFTFNQNPEWFGSTTPNFMVQFDMGKLYGSGATACHIQLRKVVAPTSANPTLYTLNLSSFVVVQNCGDTSVTTANVLSTQKIAQVSFQAAGGAAAVGDGTLTTGANLSVSAGSLYPTTLALKGGITFE
jgi:hypothetical protein